MRLLNPSGQVRGEKPGNATPMGRFAFLIATARAWQERARCSGAVREARGAAPARARHTGRRAPSGSGIGRDLNWTVSSVRASYQLRPSSHRLPDG